LSALCSKRDNVGYSRFNMLHQIVPLVTHHSPQEPTHCDLLHPVIL
jgi:hypothetical protein